MSQAEGLVWIALLAGLPLLIVPWARDSYLMPKFFWAEALIVLLGCMRLGLTLLGAPMRLALNPALGALVVFALWSLISVSWAQSRSLAWDDARFWLLAALGAFLLQCALWRRPRLLRALGIGLLASAGATAVWALAEDFVGGYWPEKAWVKNQLEDWRRYIAAGLGNTGHVADILAMAYPLAFLALCRAKRTVGLAVGLGLLWLMYAALIVCFSVHSNSGLILAMLLTAGLLWRRHGQGWFWRRGGRLSLLAAGWIAIAVFFSTDTPGNPHRPGIFRQAFASEQLKFGWDSRVFIWRTTLEMIRGDTWLGAGAGNFAYRFPDTRSPIVEADLEMRWMTGSWTNAAHNSLLQIWSELGIVGAAILLLLFVLAIGEFGAGLWANAGGEAEDDDQHWRIAALAALAAYAVHAQMNFPLQMAPASMILMMLVGMACVLERPIEDRMRLPDLGLEYAWGRFVIEFAAFTRPKAVRVELRPRPALAAVVTLLVLCPLAGYSVQRSWRKQRSDVVYRAASLSRDRAFGFSAQNAGAAPAEMDQAVQEAMEEAFALADRKFRQALDLWPNHHDCRSAYTEMLVRQGRAEEALAHLDIVTERLRAWELHWRRGRAKWMMGDREGARSDIRRGFEMKPAEGFRRPAVAVWAQGQDPPGEYLAPLLEIPR